MQLYLINSKLNEEFIPGTVNIHVLKAGMEGSEVKMTKKDVVLFPQPSDSVNDPLNWTAPKKLWNLTLLAFITGFTAGTANDADSILNALNMTYHVSWNAITYADACLFAFIGISAFLLAPAAALYGRKIPYVICTIASFVGAILMGLTTSSVVNYFAQIFIGVSLACTETTVQRSLTDLFFQHQHGSVLTIYMFASSVGTYLGPLIAFLIVDLGINYRWIGWFAAIIAGCLLVVIFFGMHETTFDRSGYPASTIVEETSDGAENSRSSNESKTGQKYLAVELARPLSGSDDEKLSYWQSVALITPAPNLIGFGIKQYFKQLVLSTTVFCFPACIFSGLVYAIHNVLLIFYMSVEEDNYFDPPYNYSDAGVALMNVPCIIGAAIGCIYAGFYSDYFVIWAAKRNHGIQEAEFRLYLLIVPAILFPLGLIIFGVGTDQKWPWPATYFGLVLIGFGTGSSGDISMNYIMEAFPEMVVEMLAVVSLVNNSICCGFSFFCTPWLAEMSVTKTFIIMAALSLFVMLLALYFVFYGKALRISSKRRYLKFCERRDGKRSQE